MKLFKVARGLVGFALYRDNPQEDFHTKKEIVVNKDWTFMDTLMDPIRAHNVKIQRNRSGMPQMPKMEEVLAGDGYAVFVDHDRPNLALAIKYDEVEVLA